MHSIQIKIYLFKSTKSILIKSYMNIVSQSMLGHNSTEYLLLVETLLRAVDRLRFFYSKNDTYNNV